MRTPVIARVAWQSFVSAEHYEVTTLSAIVRDNHSIKDNLSLFSDFNIL